METSSPYVVVFLVLLALCLLPLLVGMIKEPSICLPIIAVTLVVSAFFFLINKAYGPEIFSINPDYLKLYFVSASICLLIVLFALASVFIGGETSNGGAMPLGICMFIGGLIPAVNSLLIILVVLSIIVTTIKDALRS